VCAKVGSGYHLFVGQTLEAIKKEDEYRLTTLAYAYRITEGPSFDDPWIVRWEYESRALKAGLQPRHHCHLPATIKCFGRRPFDSSKLHIPSGWITVEEVIRFLIQELKVRPKRADWDRLLCESEERFRDWTGRDA